MKVTGRDIVVMGIQPWDIEIGSNCKNIATEMSRHNRVLYVNQPLDRRSKRVEKETEKVKTRLAVLDGKQPAIHEVQPNLWVFNPPTIIESINWLPDGPVFDWLNGINGNRFAKAVHGAIAELNFTNFLLFNDSSMFLGLHMKRLLKPAVYVYYMRDYLTKNPYWRKHGLRIEPKLIANADVVVNNSILYTEYGLKYNPHCYMVGQGCEVDDFDLEKNPVDVAEDIKQLDHPLIGYVGFLTSRRLNIPMLEELTLQSPDWTYILVGPEDELFQQSALHQRDNVHFLGSRKPEDLPSYIKGFDVCLNPQVINDATIGNYPRKIDEYLAMGKPTVASSTKAMEYFSEYTYLGVSAEDYKNRIQQALLEDNEERREQRKAYAKGHTWENNVKAIFESIEKTGKL